MSTRSFIAVQDSATSQFIGIYCHYDGYPQHTGKILLNHYTDYDKVKQLINGGDLSFLGPEIGESNDFQQPNEQYCLYYYRDRKESWNSVKPKIFSSLTALIRYARRCWCDYVYIFMDNKWKCYSGY